MSNYKKTFLTQDGRKVNIYTAAARDEVSPEALEHYGTGHDSPLRYQMCEGCEKPIVVHGPTLDKARDESEKESRAMVVWCIECLNHLGYEARFVTEGAPTDMGQA